MSTFQRWADRFTARERTASTPAEILYRTYCAWCVVEGAQALSRRAWGEAFAELGHKAERTSAGKVFVGVKLVLPVPDPDPLAGED